MPPLLGCHLFDQSPSPLGPRRGPMAARLPSFLGFVLPEQQSLPTSSRPAWLPPTHCRCSWVRFALPGRERPPKAVSLCHPKPAAARWARGRRQTRVPSRRVRCLWGLCAPGGMDLGFPALLRALVRSWPISIPCPLSSLPWEVEKSPRICWTELKIQSRGQLSTRTGTWWL